jgi:hypothetical protein
MDVLACSSCGRQFGVHGEGALEGQRCNSCDGELELVSSDVSRMSLLRRRRPSPRRRPTAKRDIQSASDVDAEIAALAKLAREAERA